MSIIADVKAGKVSQTEAITSTAVKKIGTSELGKDAFLQLLVTQMKNQDPLNPSTDTEFVAQLAQFSQLESLQNLTAANDKSQAFSLVGKDVIVQTTDSNGTKKEVSGIVDYVSMSGSKNYLSINDNLYKLDELVSVIDNSYLVAKGSPSILEQQNLEFDGDNPSNLSFEVNLGSGDYLASEIAVVIDGNIINPNYATLIENKIVLDKNAISEIKDGRYAVTVVFNDKNRTTVSDKVALTVKNANISEDTEDEEPSQTDDTIDAIV